MRVKNININVFICLLLLTSIFSLIIQYHVISFEYVGIGGLFVPDAIGLETNIDVFINDPDSNFLGIYGVMLIYWPSYYLGHIYNLVINSFLLCFSAIYFFKTLLLLPINIKSRNIILIFGIVLSNFYLIEILYFPNKEVVLIFLTNAFFFYLINNKKIIPLIIVMTMALFIRDGHGLILILTFMVSKVFKNYLLRYPFKFLIIVFAFFSVASIQVISSLGILGDYNFILDRNINLVENADSVLSGSLLNQVPSYLAYFLKVINHFVSSAIRPQFIDLNDRLYLLGVGLWQNGIIIFLGVLSWIYIILNFNSDRVLILGVSVILGLLLISVGAYTQPRYMMPYIFWLVAGAVYVFDLNTIVIVVLLLLLISLFLSFLGLGAPIPLGIDIISI